MHLMSDSELQAELVKFRSVIPMGSTWRHRRGDEYFVVGYCVLAGYRVPAVLCRGNDGIVWCRPAAQFLDGRFMRMDGVAPDTDKIAPVSAVGTAPAD
jgi:hypothetical protein